MTCRAGSHRLPFPCRRMLDFLRFIQDGAAAAGSAAGRVVLFRRVATAGPVTWVERDDLQASPDTSRRSRANSARYS
jgi:hypothetical protein